jgi:hypothetical protein
MGPGAFGLAAQSDPIENERPMSDIFREIEEEVRRDRALDLVKKYQNLFIGVALLIVLGTAGWRFYQHQELQKAQESGARFEQALEDSRAGRPAETQKILSDLEKSGTSGYRTLARLRDAAELGTTDAKKGIAAFDALAADTALPKIVQDLARLRAALLISNDANAETLRTKLQPLLSGSEMSGLAREVIGLSLLKAEQYEAAGKEFDAILTDPNASLQLKSRVDLYLGLVKSGSISK